MKRMYMLPLALSLTLGTAAILHAGEKRCCEIPKAEDGWCGDCNVGYFAQIKLKNKKIYAKVTGREVDKEALECEECKSAAEKNGECEQCEVFYADYTKYESPFSHSIALGKKFELSSITCEICKKKMGVRSRGWCSKCKQGFVANHSFDDRKMYRSATKAHSVINLADKKARKCVTCGLAMVVNGKCESCEITYDKGKPVKERGERKSGRDKRGERGGIHP